MEGIIIISVIAGFITGLIGMYVAKEKNRSGSEGFWFGFLLSLVGVIIVALLPTKEAKVAPKKVELTEEQLEEKKKRFEEAQISNRKMMKGFVFLSLFVIVGTFFMSTYFGQPVGFSGNIKTINISQFEMMLNDEEIKEVNIFKDDGTVEVILQVEALNKDKHIANSFGERTINGPHYRFEYGNLELFVDKLKNAEKKGIEFKYTFRK